MPDKKDSQPEKSGVLQKILTGWAKNRRKPANPNGLQESMEALVEIHEDPTNDYITDHERMLLSNILKLRDMRVVNVMIPRANVVAIEIGTTQEQLLTLLSERQFSRIPVYKKNLDNVLGTIHIKDVLATLAKGEEINISKIITDIPIVSPAMTILNLMLEMRQNRRHMALVVDEFGGIDGLVTIGDVIESIVGEIEDEHDIDTQPQIIEKEDGSFIIDARLQIEEFENRFGSLLTEDERKDSDTLNGLVFVMAGRIPARGEILTHSTGMVFEVADADPRRIHVLRVRNIPSPPPQE